MCNVLGIGVTTNDPIPPSAFTNSFLPQVQSWLSNNPTKRPLYVILFQNVPQEVDSITNVEAENDIGAEPSVQYQLHYSTMPFWSPFVTAINMNGTVGTNFNSSDGTNDCIAYINKLTNMASSNPPGTLFISAWASGYKNTNWYFDDANAPYPSYPYGQDAEQGVESNGVSSLSITYTSVTNLTHITSGTNVAGYFTWGWDGGLGSYYDSFATNGQIRFSGNSGWYIMCTGQSFDGQRITFQGNYLTWFLSNSFAGTDYANTPVGAVTTVNEPGINGKPSTFVYYGEWAAGKSFAISAWAAQVQGNGEPGLYFQAVGDPFVKK